MAMSGIAVSNECVCAHEAQRSKKGVQYTIYKIGDCKDHDDEQQMKGKKPKQEIVVDRCCDKCFKADDVQDKSAEEVEELGKKVFTDFIDTLPEREPRYAVFDYVWKAQSSGSYNDKLKFISWSPDAAQVKQKMIYSSTKDSLKKKLNISGKDIFLASKNPDDISEAYEKLLKEN